MTPRARELLLALAVLALLGGLVAFARFGGGGAPGAAATPEDAELLEEAMRHDVLSLVTDDPSYVRTLLRRGYPPDHTADDATWPALHAAAAGGHVASIRLLAARGAELDRIHAGWSPLGLALLSEHEEAAEALKELGASVVSFPRGDAR